MKQCTIGIRRLTDSALSHADLKQLDDIFYSSSGTQTFASPAARAAFRHRWLGSYLSENAAETFIATVSDGTSQSRIVGYLVGALTDPASDPRYADLHYFQTFARWTMRYPAHLHINIAAQHRSAGVGVMLLEAFADHARGWGAPGMHVVTGKGMRNVGFYTRNGFSEVAEAPWKGNAVVMLARPLATP